MARQPGVFVRELSMDEGRKLQRITRTAKDPVRLQRSTSGVRRAAPKMERGTPEDDR
jgi:hypothetical protein